MMKKELTTKEIIEKLTKRRDFLMGEVAAADRLDGWSLDGLTKELKSIRKKLNELSPGRKND